MSSFNHPIGMIFSGLIHIGINKSHTKNQVIFSFTGAIMTINVNYSFSSITCRVFTRMCLNVHHWKRIDETYPQTPIVT